jgi:hypothetical protein
MSTATAPSTQAATDAATHAAYLTNGESKAATARALGIQPGTVADRIKRHTARTAQDDAAEAPQVSPYVADPENPTDAELAAAVERGLADGTLIDSADWLAQQAAETADPAAATPAVTFEDAIFGILGGTMAAGEAYNQLTGAQDAQPEPAPEVDKIAEFAAQANAEAAERGGYQGTACPACHRVAFAFKGGHDVGCVFGSTPTPVPAGEFPVPVAIAAAYIEASGATAPETPEPAVEADGHEGHRHTAEAPATATAEGETVEDCVRCGFRFPRPQRRQTCQSERACQRRQAAKVTAPASV